MRESLRGVPYSHPVRLPGASLAQVSCSAKLSPVVMVETGGKKRPVPQGPFCSSTHVSIRSTCPDSCAFKDNGCYAQTGTSRRIMKKLDIDKRPGTLVATHEARLINRAFGGGGVPQDGARGGRDLRLHVGGDVSGQISAERLAFAAEHWRERGGGAAWTYTHRWREIPAASWGPVVAWASCETMADVREAHRAGYRAALVYESTTRHSPRAFHLDGGEGDGVAVRVIPCPFETRGVTCVKCRLCLDAPIDKHTVIGFSAHGQLAGAARAAIAKRRLAVVS